MSTSASVPPTGLGAEQRARSPPPRLLTRTRRAVQTRPASGTAARVSQSPAGVAERRHAVEDARLARVRAGRRARQACLAALAVHQWAGTPETAAEGRRARRHGGAARQPRLPACFALGFAADGDADVASVARGAATGLPRSAARRALCSDAPAGGASAAASRARAASTISRRRTAAATSRSRAASATSRG
jgi:hypothetical protein